MKRAYFYTVLLLSVVMAAGFPVAIFIGSSSMNLAGALAGLSGFLFISYLREKSVGMKNQNRLKMYLNSSENLVEILIVAGLMLSTAVPKILVVPLLSALIMLKVLETEISGYLKTKVRPKFGQDYRIYISLTAAGLALLNSYYTFLGSILLVGVTTYDIGSVVYHLYTRESNTKMKDRILSH